VGAVSEGRDSGWGASSAQSATGSPPYLLTRLSTLLILSRRKVLKDNIRGISKADIRRLARRRGVKRISASIYEEARGQLKYFLEKLLFVSVKYGT
jgi:histone H3/H4